MYLQNIHSQKLLFNDLGVLYTPNLKGQLFFLVSNESSWFTYYYFFFVLQFLIKDFWEKKKYSKNPPPPKIKMLFYLNFRAASFCTFRTMKILRHSYNLRSTYPDNLNQVSFFVIEKIYGQADPLKIVKRSSISKKKIEKTSLIQIKIQ